VRIRFPYFRWRSEATVYLRERNEYLSKLAPSRDQYYYQLQHFVGSVAEDREPSPSGLDGLESMRMVYAIHGSAAENRRVELW